MPLVQSATNHTLELVTTTTTATSVAVSGRDNQSFGQTPVAQESNVSSAATTTISAAPGSGVQRQVDDIQILVTGSGNQGVKVQKNNGSIQVAMINIMLNTGERCAYSNDQGFRVFDSLGREKGIPVGFAQNAAPTVFAVAGAYTYNPPLGTTAVLIELWGGASQGGGAATAASSAGAGAGGNCGGYVRKFLIGVPASLAGSVGAAGSGAGAGLAGAAGGNTTCTTASLTATGGLGGTLGAANTAPGNTLPGSAVTGTGGDENLPGAIGDAGVRLSGTVAIGGCGGLIPGLGNPGQHTFVAGAGIAATGNCAGGGGALVINASAAAAGGAGTPGYARFTPYSG